MKYVIYMHKCKINNKIYIGMTSQNLAKRWQRGLGYTKCSRFYQDIKKYGWDNFEHYILFCVLSREEAEKKEKELILHYNSNNPNFGYNIYEGGLHSKIPEEQRIKISNKERGKIISQETINKTNKTKRENYLKYGLTIKQKEHYKKLVKPIICIETGKIYYGQKDLKQNGFNPANIQCVCSGKRELAYKCHWKYYKGEIL